MTTTTPTPALADMDLDNAIKLASMWASAEHEHARNLGRGGPGQIEQVEKAEAAARAAIEALARRAAQPVAPVQACQDADPLTDFQEGQWWIEELDGMARSEYATNDQKRAVAVVHHLLRSVAENLSGNVTKRVGITTHRIAELVTAHTIHAPYGKSFNYVGFARDIEREAATPSPQIAEVAELPPLPEPETKVTVIMGIRFSSTGYTDKHMQDYARDAIAASRRAAGGEVLHDAARKLIHAIDAVPGVNIDSPFVKPAIFALRSVLVKIERDELATPAPASAGQASLDKERQRDSTEAAKSAGQAGQVADAWHDAVFAECMKIETAYKADDPAGTVRALIHWYYEEASGVSDGVKRLADNYMRLTCVAERAAAPAELNAARLEKFIDWYLRGGKRMEIDPHGHIRVTTREHIINWLDGGSNEGSR